MKKFLFLFLSLFLIGGLNSVKAEKLYSDFSEISAGGATWDAETHTMGWSASWSNAVQYFMLKGIENVGGYYDLSSWETITVTFSLTGTTNGVRIRMKDDSGDGEWILMSEGTNTLKITDFKRTDKNSIDYKKIVGIQLSGGNQTSAASTATFTELYLERPDDPLALPKEKLTNAINIGGIQNSFAKTTASWNALQDAITAGQAELINEDATEKSLTDAKDAINNAVAGLKLTEGYVNLTKAMFHEWSGIEDDATIIGDGGCDLVIGEIANGGMVYGNASVKWNQYAKIINPKSIIILGTPNGITFGARTDRLEVGNGGGDENGGSLTTVNLTIDENGIALADLSDKSSIRINAIKNGWGGAATITDLLVEYKPVNVTVTDAGYATFSSNLNTKVSGTKAYAAKINGNKVVLTEVTEIPSGSAVIVEKEGNYQFPVLNEAEAIADNDLKVSDGSVTGDESTIYVLGNGSHGVGFYLLKSGKTLEAGKAYLKIENAARGFIGINGMDVTGISTVKQAAGAKTGKIYNLNGQIVNKPTKGLFIVDGKVVSF